MTEEKRSHNNTEAFIWGIILVFIGFLLLLQTFNILPWSLWGTLWRFWPAIIIIIGVGVLLRHKNAWLALLITIAILGGCLGVAIWQHGTDEIPQNITTQSYEQPIENLKSAEVNINFNAGSLTLGAITSGAANLIEADTEIKNDIPSMATRFDRRDNQGTLYLNSINQQYWPDGGIIWQVNLSDEIPISIEIESSASTLTLDLFDLDLSSLNLDINASTCKLKLPSPNGMLNTAIKANAATLNITIPDGAAARISASSTVAIFNISSRFTKEGNYYVTDNYDGAKDRIELTVDTNVGTVTIR